MCEKRPYLPYCDIETRNSDMKCTSHRTRHPEFRAYHGYHLCRCPAKAGFKALHNVNLDPWRIGDIVAAALVVLHVEHARTT